MVDDLIQDFNSAYERITGSESVYSAAVSRLQVALDSVPSRFSRVTDSLGRYQRASSGLAASELKRMADELFGVLNDTYSLGSDFISGSLPVSVIRTFVNIMN